MDLSGALLRFGAARPHVLLAEMPGGGAQRRAVEAELRERGWPAAVSPAEADILVLAGPASLSLDAMVNRLWSQLARPRAFAHLTSAAAVSEVLERAHRELTHGTDSGDTVLEQNHGDMEMPGGLEMAGRGPDRDGLQLDRLHVPLGPFLPDWPAGLVVHTTLQGDVIQRAEPEWVGADTADAPIPHGADLLDSLARLLGVAGWADAAARARLLRDGILGAAEVADIPGQLTGLIRRVRRSRTLRWLTDGLGVLPRTRAERAGLGDLTLRASDGRGDVTARWMAWLDELDRIDAVARSGVSSGAPAVLSEVLEGVELASARLIVASLDPDLKRMCNPTEVSGA